MPSKVSAGPEGSNSTGSQHDEASVNIEIQLETERARATNLQRQLNKTTERCFELEAEMADFSSYLLDEANGKVADANRTAAEASRRVAGLLRQIQERDVLVEAQQQQLDFLKNIIAEQDEIDVASPRGSIITSSSHMHTEQLTTDNEQLNFKGGTNISTPELLAEALKSAQWFSPTRPVYRRDTVEFVEFLKMLPQEGVVATMLKSKSLNKIVSGVVNKYATDSAGAGVESQHLQPPSPGGPLTSGQAAERAAERAESQQNWSSWKLGFRTPDPSTTSSDVRRPFNQCKFVYRSITEDIAPALRLEQAPHLSWLVRRAWQTAVVEGTLEIEPIPVSEKLWIFRPSYPCVMCGQAREEEPYGRKHVVRVPKDTHSYAIGDECLTRLRFACDYLGFLRTLYNNMRKLETKEQVYSLWEECVRLKEQIFCARTGMFYLSAPSSPNGVSWSSMDATSVIRPADVPSTIQTDVTTQNKDTNAATATGESEKSPIENSKPTLEEHKNPSSPRTIVGIDADLDAQLDDLDDSELEDLGAITEATMSPVAQTFHSRAGSPAVIAVQSAVKVLSSAVTTVSVAEAQSVDTSEVD